GLQSELRLSILFITHDLGIVAEMCDRVAVMYAGQIVENAGVDDLLLRPRHPYTEGLLGSIPKVGAGRRLESIPGVVPLPNALPRGCRFHTRCSYAVAGRCDEQPPSLLRSVAGETRCLRVDEIELRGVMADDPVGGERT